VWKCEKGHVAEGECRVSAFARHLHGKYGIQVPPATDLLGLIIPNREILTVYRPTGSSIIPNRAILAVINGKIGEEIYSLAR
jgi:hypothetical protein